MEKPLLVTDGHYIWAHHLGKTQGPWVARLTDDGQIADPEYNSNDLYGVKFNPEGCAGGRIHKVENVYAPPDELIALQTNDSPAK